MNEPQILGLETIKDFPPGTFGRFMDEEAEYFQQAGEEAEAKGYELESWQMSPAFLFASTCEMSLLTPEYLGIKLTGTARSILDFVRLLPDAQHGGF